MPVTVATKKNAPYEVRPRKDHRGVDLISMRCHSVGCGMRDASAAVDYAKHRSRSHDAVIRVYTEAGNVIETYEHAGRLQKSRKRGKQKAATR
jgi:hypothetical protein